MSAVRDRRPSSAHGFIADSFNGRASRRGAGAWSDDLDDLLSEAMRLCPAGWEFNLSWGHLFSDGPYEWTASWTPRRGPGYDALFVTAPFPREAIAGLLDRRGELPR